MAPCSPDHKKDGNQITSPQPGMGAAGRGGDPQDGAVNDAATASHQFLQEVNVATALLLDSVIRDVVSTTTTVHPPMMMGEDPPPSNSPNDSGDLQAMPDSALEESASHYVYDLIDTIAEPQETREMRTEATSFLDRILDRIDNQVDIARAANRESNFQAQDVSLSAEGFLDSVVLDVANKLEKRLSVHENDESVKSISKDGKTEEIETDSVNDMPQYENKSVAFYVPMPETSRNRKKAKLKSPKKFQKQSAYETHDLSIEELDTENKTSDLSENSEFEALVDGLLGKIIHDSLAMFNPLYKFYRASGSLEDLLIKDNPEGGSSSSGTKVVQSSFDASSMFTLSDAQQSTTLTTSESSFYPEEPNQVPIDSEAVCSSSWGLIAERKVFDLKRWYCISRPQYKYSCGISSVVSCFNYLFSTLGNGDLPPVTQETALKILGFSPPYGNIRFGPFTGNATLKKWFNRLTAHYKVRGYFYMLYKPKGGEKTKIPENVALERLKEGLSSTDTTFIYHCYNHYMVPMGFEETPTRPETAYASVRSAQALSVDSTTFILIGDPSQKYASIHCVPWTDIVTDLNCESPEHFNIRKRHLGVFGGRTPAGHIRRTKKTGGNLHCIMALTRLRDAKTVTPKTPKK